MINLYGRLVTDEDSRTEALVDLLERMLSKDRKEKTERFQDFVSEVLLAEPTDKGEKKRFLGMLKNDVLLDELSIKTQRQIPQGSRPDIVVFNSGRPICIVEVKVGAPIGDSQLENYGDFLKEAAQGKPTALVLLTRGTQPPEGFTDEEGCDRYDVGLRSIASWNNTADWFEKLSREGNGVDEPLKSLAREFSDFLKEYAMPTLDDVTIARLYLAGTEDRLTEAVKNMGEGYEFSDGWTPKRNISDQPVGVCKWHSQAQRWIGYGLCFKPVDENDQHLHGYQRYENDALDGPKPVEDGFYAYVCIGGPADQWEKIPGYSNNQWYERNEADKLTPAEDQLLIDSTEWYYYSDSDDSEAYYAKIRPIQELLDGDGRIGNKLQKWAHEVLGDAVKLLEALPK